MRRFGTGILLPALLLLSPHTAGGQSASFKADPQLHAKVTIVDRNPELSAIFDQFERATGLKFTLDEPILAHRPKLGEFQLRDAPVWRVMELIPKIGLVGGSWEKTPGGYRLTAKALAPRKDPTPPKVGPAQVAKTNPPKDLHLRRDPRLQVKVTVASRPTLSAVLQTLGEATGLTFTMADDLQDHQPDLGSAQLRNVPAWMVMGLVTETEMREGRWEKTESGYRLTGESLALRRSTTNPLVVLLLWLLPGMAILGLTGFYLRRRKRASTPPTPQAASAKP